MACNYYIGTGFNNLVFSVNVNSNNKIFIGGGFTTFNSSTRNNLVKINGDGSEDLSFNIGTGFSDISLLSSVYGTTFVGTDIYTYGFYTEYSGETNNNLIRLILTVLKIMGLIFGQDLILMFKI